MITTDRNNPDLNQPSESGQNKAYLVLTQEEIDKGFIRPVRDSYIHVGKLIPVIEGQTIRELSEFEKGNNVGFVAYVVYPESESPKVGRFITQQEKDNLGKRFGGCGGLTKMNSVKICETYARDPKFYGATFCVHCEKHLPVSEFFWDNTEEEVGS